MKNNESHNYLSETKLENFQEELSKIKSFKQLINYVFPSDQNLILHDVGAGDGNFALSVALKKKDWGIEKVIASDKDIFTLKQNEDLKNYADIQELDLTKIYSSKDKCHIVTANAPVVKLEYSFFENIFQYCQQNLYRPGLLVMVPYKNDLYLFEDGTLFNKIDFEKLGVMRHGKLNRFNDYPKSVFTDNLSYQPYMYCFIFE